MISLRIIEKTSVFDFDKHNNIVLVAYLDELNYLIENNKNKNKNSIKNEERKFKTLCNLNDYVYFRVSDLIWHLNNQYINKEITELSYKIVNDAQNLNTLLELLTRIRENKKRNFLKKEINYINLKDNYLAYIYKHMDLVANLNRIHSLLSELEK